MKRFLILLSVIGFGAMAQASELSCTTASSPDRSITKISTSVYKTVFGSVKRLLTIKKVDSDSGREVQGYTHTFEVDSINTDSQFVQISGIKMVNTGDGINGMTNFDALSLGVNKATKAGSLHVQPTYSAHGWSLKFTCSSFPSL